MHLRYGYEIVGGILIFISSLVGEQMSDNQKKGAYLTFGILALIYSTLGVYLDRRTDAEQTELESNVKRLQKTITDNDKSQREQLDKAENARRSDRDAFLSQIAKNLATTGKVLSQAERAVNPLATEDLSVDVELRIPARQPAVEVYLDRVKPQTPDWTANPADTLFPSAQRTEELPLAVVANFVWLSAFVIRKGEHEPGFRLHAMCQQLPTPPWTPDSNPTETQFTKKISYDNSRSQKPELSIWCTSATLEAGEPTFRSVLDFDGATVFLTGLDDDYYSFDVQPVEYTVSQLYLTMGNRAVADAGPLTRVKCPSFIRDTGAAGACFSGRMNLAKELVLP